MIIFVFFLEEYLPKSCLHTLSLTPFQKCVFPGIVLLFSSHYRRTSFLLTSWYSCELENPFWMSQEILFRKISRVYKYLRTTAGFMASCTFETASLLATRHQVQEREGSTILFYVRVGFLEAFHVRCGQTNAITAWFFFCRQCVIRVGYHSWDFQLREFQKVLHTQLWLSVISWARCVLVLLSNQESGMVWIVMLPLI